MNVFVLSASPTREGSTKKVSQFLVSNLKEAGITQIELMDFDDFDFPSIGRAELDPLRLSPFQEKLISAWAKADLVFINCPEYNWSVNGDVLTVLEQLGTRSFSDLFDQKVFAMVGVSSGRGGRLPALELSKIVNKLISFLGKLSIVSPKILEAHDVLANLDENGSSKGNYRFDTEVRKFIHYSLMVAERWLVKESKF